MAGAATVPAAAASPAPFRKFLLFIVVMGIPPESTMLQVE
jgi:hypothetical protein